jgi:catechol 2,3-dioxygenase-like lactoylglutathione lyase family enzyme
MQIDHLTIPVRTYEAGKRFYADALAPLGFRLLLDWPHRRRAYFGVESTLSSLWVVESTFAGALDVALALPDEASVIAFHTAALAAGARSLAEPGAGYEFSRDGYSARIADFDGNAIEAVYRAAPVAASVAA